MFAKTTGVQIHSLSPMLSEAIKECRIALDLSPQEFARKIYKSADFVYDVEQAEIAINSDVLEDSASVFGLSVGELVEIAVSEKSRIVASVQRSIE